MKIKVLDVVENVYRKYRNAIQRAAYVATQQLHVLQLRFLQSLARELDEDSNENMSVSAFLNLPESQPVQQITCVDSDDEVPLSTGDL